MKTLVTLLILTLMMGCAQKDSPEQTQPQDVAKTELPKETVQSAPQETPENEQAFTILKAQLGTVSEVKNFENLDLSKSMVILIAHNVALSFSYIPAGETLGVEKGIVSFDTISK